jgi:hypothetical protein
MACATDPGGQANSEPLLLWTMSSGGHGADPGSATRRAQVRGVGSTLLQGSARDRGGDDRVVAVRLISL